MSKHSISSTEVGENSPFAKISFDAVKAKSPYSFQQVFTSRVKVT